MFTREINMKKCDNDGFRIFLMSGSCCDIVVNSPEELIKKINKSVSGVDNGFKKFYYEIQHVNNESKMFPELYPKILEIRDTPLEYSVKYEFCYCGKTLADLLRNNFYSHSFINKSLEFVINKLFHDYYSISRNSKPNEDYINICYPNRIEQRLDVVRNEEFIKNYGCSDKLIKMMDKGVYINGQYYPSIYKYTDYIKKDKELKKLLNINHNTYSHHDLIPANIVVDTSGNSRHISAFRFIDPRGEQETGVGVRHFMYDMGKMLVGLDTLDIFRIFNGKIEKKLYQLDCLGEKDGVLQFQMGFDLKDSIIKNYKEGSAAFWDIMKKHHYFSDLVGETEENLRLKYLFSFAHMFHPDIPCRIIFEREEEIPVGMYLRGLMVYRTFMDYAYGMDPLREATNHEKVEMWPDIELA